MANYSFYSGFTELMCEKGIEKAADLAAGLGFSSVEFLDAAGEGYPRAVKNVREAQRIKRALDERGIGVSCYSVGATVFENEAAVRSLMRHAEIAQALGSPFLHHTLLLWLALPENAPSVEEGLRLSADAAVRVAQYAETMDLMCIYEDQGMYVNGVENFRKFYSAVKRQCKNVGVCGDVGNIMFVDESPEVFFRSFASEIVHVHLKDYYRKCGGESPGKGWFPTKGGNWLSDARIGSGEVNFAAVMKILKDAGYRGAYALETGFSEPVERDVKQVMMDLDSCMK